MDTSQYKLCCEVMKRLANEGVLKHVLLIGGWCMLAYEDYFSDVAYRPAIRTRDVDLLVPLPHKIKKKVDIEELLRDLDFVINFKGSDGYISFVHADLSLEFLVPERGRGSDKPYPLPELGANASALRYLDFLSSKTIGANFGGIALKVPHPVNFSIHKIILSELRNNPVKRENDLRQGVQLLRALIGQAELNAVHIIVKGMTKTWQKLIRKALADTIDEDLISQIWTDG